MREELSMKNDALPELACASKSGWETFSAGKDRRAMDGFAGDYLDFISRCKTERETIDHVAAILHAQGFGHDFAASGKAFRCLHGKTLFAVRRAVEPFAAGMRLVASHADAPRLDFKQHPLLEQAGVGQAKTHYYGGIRKYQWLARPLALHGVVIRENGETVRVVLGEDRRDPVFTIADLLPHLAGKQDTKTLAEVFEAEKLNVILGHVPAEKAKKGEKENKDPIKANLLARLHKKYGIKEEDLYSAELQAVPAGPGRTVGLDSGLIGAYGQDDRICVFTSMRAFLEAEPRVPACLVLWDKEEVGSEGSTGAQSRFLEYCIRDMLAAWEPETSFGDAMLHSRALSADVHAALDPDWQDLHEKLNAAVLGHGPCLCKFTGSRGKYGANDAHPEYVAWLRRMLNRRGIPWQMAELGKVDGGGGGTVALYLAAYGMNVIDMGPALLGMHSPFELSSKVDLYATRLAYQGFYEE
jgi:aspartyl aminopeptidase